MNRIYQAQAIIGIVFAFFVAYVAYANSIEGRPDLAPGRIILATFLTAYSVAQLFRVSKSNASLTNVFCYPILYIVFGVFWEAASRAYIKDWAPATQSEAMVYNVVCLLILIGFAGLASLTALKKECSENIT